MTTQPQEVTLKANTVSTVTITEALQSVLVTRLDGATPVYFTVDGSTPTTEGTSCWVLGPSDPSIGVLFSVPGAGSIYTTAGVIPPPVVTNKRPTRTVKLISAGASKVSVETY